MRLQKKHQDFTREAKKVLQKKRLPGGKKAITFSVGEKVLLFTARQTTRKGDKLAKKWTGPYTISEIVGSKHVFLDGKKVKKNIKHLKPWIFEEEKTESKTETRPNAEDNTNNLVPNPTVDEGENEAEEIVDRDMKEKSKSRIHENDDSEIAFADNTNVTGFCEDDSMLPNQEQFEHYLKEDDDPRVHLRQSDKALRKQELPPNAVVDTIWECSGVGYCVSNINGISLSDNRILELKGESYLSDEVIDVYLVLLSRLYSNQNVKIEDYDFVVGGNNVNSCHWTLVMVKPKEGALMFLNSFGELQSQVATLMKNWKVAYLNALTIAWRYVALSHPKQTDGFNCGVYTMKFAEQIIAKGHANIANKTADMERYLKEIAELLVASSDGRENGWCSVCSFYEGDDVTLVHAVAKAIENPSPPGSPQQVLATPKASKIKIKYRYLMMKVGKKTGAKRCEACRAPFKEKQQAMQRFLIGHYSSKPFYLKRDGTSPRLITDEVGVVPYPTILESNNTAKDRDGMMTDGTRRKGLEQSHWAKPKGILPRIQP
eukprot:gene3533-2017_t